jgi:hypothetical protein
LCPNRGQAALAPWRLTLVTIMQFRADLYDCRAADAVRTRIDWKYLLGLEVTKPGVIAFSQVYGYDGLRESRYEGPMRISYARGSTVEQSLDLLKQAGC